MTQEEEEVQHDLSKLQEQVHQISLSQRTSKNEMEVLEKGMEANMNGMEVKMDDMEANMEDMKNDIKADMEGF